MLYDLDVVDVVRIVTALRIEAGTCARLLEQDGLWASTREHLQWSAEQYGRLAERILAGPGRETTTTGGKDGS